MTRTLSATLLAMSLVGCASQPVDDPLDTRETLLQAANNQPGLVAHYKANLQQKPEYKLALINVYLDQGDIRSAELYTSLLSEQERKQAQVKLALARIECQQQNWQTCEQKLEAYRQAGGDTVQYLLNLGRASAGQGRFDQAFAQFEEARRLGAEDLLVQNNQAVVRMMQQRYTDAMALLYPLYLSHPSDGGIQANLILASIQADRPEVALDVLRQQFDEQQAQRRLRALVGGMKPKQKSQVLWMKEDVQESVASQPETAVQPQPEVVASSEAQPMKAPEPQNIEKDKSQSAGDLPPSPPVVAAPPAQEVAQCVIEPAEDKQFCIQVTSWDRPLSQRMRNDFAKRYGSLFEHHAGDRYRYCVSEFDTLNEAKAFLPQITESGAYVVTRTNCHKQVAP
ncbi:tetratricopeptide repeat protein [Ferrimonas sp.]|uniref:tetratricopeptide repeat protein n=1 Tax=Ferrimonas sp. TaxID=2080861 RepID=UPI003A925890